MASDQVKGSVPWVWAPISMPVLSSRSPGYPQLLFDVAKIRGSHDFHPHWFDYLLEQLTELKEIHTFTSLLKDVIKDTHEQPDEDIHKDKVGEGTKASSCQ